LPEVPTVGEQGFPGFESNSGFIYFAPGDTPPAVLDRLNAVFVEVLNLPEVKEALTKQGVEVMATSRADTLDFIKKEMKRYADVVAIRPFSLGRRAVFLEHPAHGLAQRPQLVGPRADHIAGHDRGGGLAECAGLHVMGEVGHGIAVHLEVDGHGRAAQLGMGGSAAMRVRHAANPGDGPCKFQNPGVVDVIQHENGRCFGSGNRICLGRATDYIWPWECGVQAREGRRGQTR
jgi:hypothetical protein